MRVDQPRTQGEPQRRFISSPPSVPLVPYCRLLLGILGEFPAAQIEFFFRQKRKVEAFTGQRVVAVSAGAYHSLAIHYRRRSCLHVGQGRGRLPRPRRGPVESAAAQEGRVVGAGAVRRRAKGYKALSSCCVVLPVTSATAHLSRNNYFDLSLFSLVHDAAELTIRPSAAVYEGYTILAIKPFFFTPEFFFSRCPPRRRRSRRLAAPATAAATTAVPSPSTPTPTRLLDLPTELLVRALSRCNSPADIARVAAVSLLFHASLAIEGIRLWAQ